MIDRFELQRARDTLRIALFHVEGCWKPKVGLDVRAPAIEVVILAGVFFRSGEVAVEADDIATASLNPDAAEEAASGSLSIARGDVKDSGRRRSEKLVANVTENIVLAVEVVRIHQHHLDKASFVEVQVQAATESGDR